MYITLRIVIMSKKKFRRSILIVCEGTKTEYDYFNYIGQNISITKGIWDIVDVSTNTTIPNDIAIPPPTSLGTRKKKHFVNPNKRKISERNVMRELCIYLYGEDDGLGVVCQLLIDNGVESLGHRNICLGKYANVGISMQAHKKYSVNTVLDFN